MARRGDARLTTWRCRLCTLFGALMLGTAQPAAADLTGHWRFEWGLTDVEDIAQVGSAVSFDLMVPGLTFTFTGSVSGSNLSASAPAPVPGACGASISAVVAADENSFSGFIATILPCSTPAEVSITARRCECFDGNNTNGDGCDAQCRIEACYTCSGDPSVCVSVADGLACNDHSACTVGETCTSAICGGGGPVVPCVDLTGAWHLHYSYPDFQLESDSTVGITQTDTMLDIGGLLGTIDPFTGAFQVNDAPQYFCPGDRFAGQAALDGRTLTGIFTDYVMTPTQCPAFDAQVTGSRCGGGTVDPGEDCDDGNVTNGDGCDASCHVEPCFACTGSPSTCAPVTNGLTCDDNETCTTGDTCLNGICGGAAVPDGTSCSDSDVCTLNDRCVQGVCTGTPLACGQCEVWDGIGPACVPRANFTPCDDGNACTNGDACQNGVCAAGSPTFCLPCSGCDGGTGQCVAAPATGCLTTTSRSTLFMQNVSPDTNDSVTWQWRRGAGGTPTALLDPTQSTYALCIYDESLPTPTILFDGIAQQLACPSSGCWTPLRHGYTYRDSTGESGFTRIDLRSRSDGRVRIRTRGKGLFLSGIPTPPLALPIRAQFQALDTNLQVSTCFEAQYDSAAVSTNGTGVFRARTVGP